MTKKTGRKKAKKPAREYNNSKRAEKSLVTRAKIIELYVNLLVESGGEDVPLQVLAKKSKISLRTLFRFFGDKDTLNLEIENYLRQYLLAASDNLEKMCTADYAAYVYKIFDEYEKLFKVLLFTDFGQKSRVLFRKKFNEMLVAKIQHELQIKPDNSELQKIYFVASVLNAHLWKDIRDSFGVSGTEISGTVKWAVVQLLKDIRSSK